ncbi:MAG: DHH family phosphoesterase [Planctomycetota bacterium]
MVDPTSYRHGLAAFQSHIQPEVERLEEAAQRPGFEQMDQVAASAEEVIRQGGLITVSGHLLPDGDAIGSVLGTTAVLEQKAAQLLLSGEIDQQTYEDFRVVPVNHHRAPPNLQHLPGSADILQVADSQQATAFSNWLQQDREAHPSHAHCMAIGVDCGHLDRTGAVGPAVFGSIRQSGGMVVKIDHHEVDHGDPDSQFGDLNVSADTDAAAIEVAYLASKLGVQIPEHGLQALMTGYMTDSSFGARKDATSAAAIDYLEATASSPAVAQAAQTQSEPVVDGPVVDVANHVVQQGGSLSAQVKAALKNQERTPTETAITQAGKESLHTLDVALADGRQAKDAVAFVHVPHARIAEEIAASEDPGAWPHEVTWPLKSLPLQESRSSQIGVTVFENPQDGANPQTYKLSFRANHGVDADFPAMLREGLPEERVLAAGGHKRAAGLTVAAQSLDEVHELVDPLLGGEIRRLHADKQALEQGGHAQALSSDVLLADGGVAEQALVGTVLDSTDTAQLPEQEAGAMAKQLAKSLTRANWRNAAVGYAAVADPDGGYQVAVQGNKSYFNDFRSMIATAKETGQITDGRGHNHYQSASCHMPGDDPEQLHERIGEMLAPGTADAIQERSAMTDLATARLQQATDSRLAGLVVAEDDLVGFHAGDRAGAHRDLSYRALDANGGGLVFTAMAGDASYDVIVRGSHAMDVDYQGLARRAGNAHDLHDVVADDRRREMRFRMQADSEDHLSDQLFDMLAPEIDGGDAS